MKVWLYTERPVVMGKGSMSTRRAEVLQTESQSSRNQAGLTGLFPQHPHGFTQVQACDINLSAQPENYSAIKPVIINRTERLNLAFWGCDGQAGLKRGLLARPCLPPPAQLCRGNDGLQSAATTARGRKTRRREAQGHTWLLSLHGKPGALQENRTTGGRTHPKYSRSFFLAFTFSNCFPMPL